MKVPDLTPHRFTRTQKGLLIIGLLSAPLLLALGIDLGGAAEPPPPADKARPAPAARPAAAPAAKPAAAPAAAPAAKPAVKPAAEPPAKPATAAKAGDPKKGPVYTLR